MTGDIAITWLMEKWESFGQPITVNNAAWRALCLAFIQRSGSRMWMGTSTGAAHPEWSWTYNQADITSDSAINGEINDMPTDYHAIGKNGAIYPVNGNKQQSRLAWLPPLEMARRLRLGATGQDQSSEPCQYSEMMSNVDTGGVFIGGKRIFVWRPPKTGTVPLHMIYKQKPPIFVDSTTESNLEAIPDEYHETILMDGAIAALMDKAGDGRSAQYEAKFLRGIAEAWAEENQGQNEKRRWGARYGHGRLYGGYSR